MRISVLTPSIRPAGLEITRKCLLEQTFKDFEWIVEIGYEREGLNAIYNRMLKRATGELIVSLQDYICVTLHYLEKFWNAYQEHPTTLFTAPVGKVKNLEYAPPATWDWRAYQDAKPKFDCWEIDSGSAPRKMFFEVGGFDEVLDQWWSFDNVSVAKRAEMLGYSFGNLFDNPAIAYDHDAFMEHPYRDRFRPALVKMRMDEYETNPKLNYL